MNLLPQIQRHKDDYCKGVKGAFGKMRSTCKRYIDQERNNAPHGQKGEAAKKARIEANKIINNNCKL